MLICPKCKAELISSESGLRCKNNHCFDRSKEGYVNLLLGNKKGETTGDSKQMAHSRNAFLKTGAYSPLADAVGDLLEKNCKQNGTVLDICCGEGDYTDRLTKRFGSFNFYGFDLSKQMVRLAAKRKCGAAFFVANLSAIPFSSGSVDFAFHLFAPFHATEFYRILNKNGRLITVVAGKNHLLGLKEILYEKPYLNDEAPPQIGEFKIEEAFNVTATLNLTDNAEKMALLQMTPYFYHTPSDGIKKLEQTEALSTPLDFKIFVLKK